MGYKADKTIIVNKKLQMTASKLYEYYLLHPTICTDTRKIISGSLFFALKGENYDANKFASQAIANGAAFVIIDNIAYQTDERFLLVNDTLLALQELANYHRKQLDIPIIGLTGSNGKTTTKELILSVLSQKYKTQATHGNLNNHIGVPLTLLEIKPNCEIAIVEMGANHQQEIAHLCEICQPNFGLITNIGKAHLEGFGGFEGVKKGKGELFDYLAKTEGTEFINNNSPLLVEMAAERKFKTVLFYGEDQNNFVSGSLIKNDPFLAIEWHFQGEKHTLQSNLTGIYNFENILAAIAIGLKFSLSADEINQGIANYQPQNNRSQVTKTVNNTVICDYYNANPSSMMVAIENLSKLESPRKVLILGDMFELGEESKAEHQMVLENALLHHFDQVIFIGKEFFGLESKSEAQFFETTAAAMESLSKKPIKNALVLLKGSRSMKLEELMDLL